MNKELRLTVRVSQREAVDIYKAATKRGQTPSAFMRWASTEIAKQENTEQGQTNENTQ